eukprot:756842-Hanusia_phi.AAC.1
MGSEPLREVDAAHLPAGGAMLRCLGPGAADTPVLVQGRRVSPCHKDARTETLVSLSPEDATVPAVGQM